VTTFSYNLNVDRHLSTENKNRGNLAVNSEEDERDADDAPEVEDLSLDDLMAGFADDQADYSLEELSNAYAQIMAEQEAMKIPVTLTSDDAQPGVSIALNLDSAADGSGPPQQAVDITADPDHQTSDPADSPTDGDRANFLKPLSIDTANEDLTEDDQVAITPERIVESILFVGTSDNDPISGRLLASLMRGVSPDEIDTYVDRLNQSYEADQAAYRIIKEVLGYKMILSKQYVPVRNRFYGQIKEARLSQSIIDTLSIVAYHQPITKAKIDDLMGKSNGANINQLVRRDLLKIERSDDKKKYYKTTERFLDLFGIDSVDDLPQSEAMGEAYD